MLKVFLDGPSCLVQGFERLICMRLPKEQSFGPGLTIVDPFLNFGLFLPVMKKVKIWDKKLQKLQS